MGAEQPAAGRLRDAIENVASHEFGRRDLSGEGLMIVEIGIVQGLQNFAQGLRCPADIDDDVVGSEALPEEGDVQRTDTPRRQSPTLASEVTEAQTRSAGTSRSTEYVYR